MKKDKLLFSIFPNERFIDLTLYQYGYEQTESLHSYGPFRRNHYLFHYVISGSGQLTYEDQHRKEHKIFIRSGQGFLICPHQVTTYCADAVHPWEYVWLEFDGAKKEWEWVKAVGHKGEIFELTGTGYNKADWLKDGMGIDTSKDPLVELKEFGG